MAGADLDDMASAQMKACYMTLLGGVAWMILTCPASAVYVSYLQRHLQEPRVRHLKDLNNLVRWMSGRRRC